jgi:hypothetical protein
MTTEQLMDKLTKAITFQYKTDATAPGVTVSSLKTGEYYCSIVRWTGVGKTAKKTVVCKARSTSLDGSLKDLAQQFLSLNQTPRDPVQELGELVRPSKSDARVIVRRVASEPTSKVKHTTDAIDGCFPSYP